MGGAKRYWEEMTEGGLNLFAAEDKTVCRACFVKGSPLRSIVQANATSTTCSFCSTKAAVPVAAPLIAIVRHIEECLLRDYDDAANCLYYESAEGGYQGTTFDTFEVLEDAGMGGELTEDSGALLDTIAEALGDRTWCEADPGALREHERLSFSWQNFCRYIKHERRFFFMSAQPPYAERDGGEQLLTPRDMLHHVMASCVANALVTTCQVGTRVFRTRFQETGECHDTALALGPPPLAAATQSNRMSPPGIVMTYVAEDAATALAETVSKAGSYAIGEFELAGAVNVLDLTKLPSVPSLFEKDASPARDAVIFLHEFAREMSRPIAHDDHIHVEYIPTQVVTEYLRFAPELADLGVRGLRYRSAQNRKGTCLVLFGGRELLVLSPQESAGLPLGEAPTGGIQSCLKLVRIHSSARAGATGTREEAL